MTSIEPPRARLLAVACAALASAGCGGKGGTGSNTDATTLGPTTATDSASSTTGGTSTSSGGTTSGTAGSTSPTTGDTAVTTGDTAVSTGGSTGWPLECSCLEDGCGPPICPPVVAGCAGECPMGFMVDEAALTCALEALRDGTPGTVEWDYVLNDQGAHDSGWISVLADRAAIRGGGFDMVVCSGTESTIHGPLPGPAVYEACLVSPSPAERFDCARQVLAAITIVCAPGSNGCD